MLFLITFYFYGGEVPSVIVGRKELSGRECYPEIYVKFFALYHAILSNYLSLLIELNTNLTLISELGIRLKLCLSFNLSRVY
jgi:hypothetical protein